MKNCKTQCKCQGGKCDMGEEVLDDEATLLRGSDVVRIRYHLLKGDLLKGEVVDRALTLQFCLVHPLSGAS